MKIGNQEHFRVQRPHMNLADNLIIALFVFGVVTHLELVTQSKPLFPPFFDSALGKNP